MLCAGSDDRQRAEAGDPAETARPADQTRHDRPARAGLVQVVSVLRAVAWGLHEARRPVPERARAAEFGGPAVGLRPVEQAPAAGDWRHRVDLGWGGRGAPAVTAGGRGGGVFLGGRVEAVRAGWLQNKGNRMYTIMESVRRVSAAPHANAGLLALLSPIDSWSVFVGVWPIFAY